MKKALFTLAILVMAFGNAGFAQRNALLKSNATANMLKHYGVRDEITIVPQEANWMNTVDDQYRTTYIYDEDAYLIEETTEVNEGDGWQKESRIRYDYDFYGNVLEMVGEEWDGSDWMEVVTANFTYEGQLPIEVVYQVNMGYGWVNYMKEVYNYNGDISTVLYWEWNGTTWSSSELYTYTYGNGTIELVIQYMQGGAWQYDERQLFTLNFDEKVEEIVVQDWTGTTWVNAEQITYLYEDGVFLHKYIKEWTGSDWENEYHFSYDYDANGNAKHGECYYYAGYDWSPADNDIEMAFGYSAKSNDYYGWRVDVTYVDLTGVNETSVSNILVYPIPATDEILIQSEDFQKAEIYNLTGQKLMESSMERMDVGTLASGVYVLKVFDLTGKAETRQIVVE